MDAKTKALSRELKSDSRGIDHEVRRAEREQAKVIEEIKRAAKKGDTKTAGILAKSLVASRKQTERLQQVKTTNSSVDRNIKSAALNVKLAGHMAITTNVLGQANAMMNVQQLQQTTQEFAKQSQKMEITQEMMSEMLEGMDDDDLQDEVDQEVDNVIFEVTKGQLGSVAIPTHKQVSNADVESADFEVQLKKLLATT